MTTINKSKKTEQNVLFLKKPQFVIDCMWHTDPSKNRFNQTYQSLPEEKL